MVTRKQKFKKRILDSLNPPAELSSDKGPLILEKFKLSKKDRKHSGRRTPRLACKGKYSEIIEDAEEPKEEYDNWFDYRDGQRDITKIQKPNIYWDDDSMKLVKKQNTKIKKQLAIREAKKIKKSLMLTLREKLTGTG